METKAKIKELGHTTKNSLKSSNLIVSKEYCSPTMNCAGGGHTPYIMEEKPYRIRKLTPRECWRLMGVKDEDFDKVKDYLSDSILYHLCGDSIVVDVMTNMFKQMLGGDNERQECSGEDRKNQL